MNSRIEELETQCWEPRKYGPAWFNSEKFAKLIVQECCDIFVELRTRPADLAVKDVKRHFGIQE